MPVPWNLQTGPDELNCTDLLCADFTQVFKVASQNISALPWTLTFMPDEKPLLSQTPSESISLLPSGLACSHPQEYSLVNICKTLGLS